MKALARLVLGAMFLALGSFKVYSGVDPAAYVQPWAQWVATVAELSIGVGLVCTHGALASIGAMLFSAASLAVFLAYHGADSASSTSSCGCLGAEIRMESAQQLGLIGVLLLTSGLVFAFGGGATAQARGAE